MLAALRPFVLLLLGIVLATGFVSVAQAADERPVAAARPASGKTDLYGDPLPAGALARLGTLRWRHGGPVTFVGFADRDKHLITACADGFFRVWDVASGREVRRFGKGNDQGAALGGILGIARLFSGQIGGSVALSPDGATLASTGQEGQVHLWQIASGKDRLLQQPKEKDANRAFGSLGLAFSPDSKSLATIRNGSVRLWSVRDGKSIRQLGQPPKTDNPNPFSFLGGDALAFSPDGKSLAFADTRLDPAQTVATTIHIYNVSDGNERKQISLQTNSIFGSRLAFSSNGKILALGSTLFDAASGKEIRKLEGSSGASILNGMNMSVSAPVFSPVGNVLALKDMSNPVWSSSLQLWDAASGKMLRRLGTGGGFRFPDVEFLKRNPPSIAFSSDGKMVADAGGGNTIRLWQVAEGKEIVQGESHSEGITALAVSADGKTLASYGQDETVRRWDLATAKELRRFRAAWLGSGATNVTFAPDARLAAGTFFNLVVIWDVAAGRTVRSLRVPSKQTFAGAFGDALALTPDGKRLAVRANDLAIHIFDVATGKEVDRMPEQLAPPNSNNGMAFVAAFFGGVAGNTARLVFSTDGDILAAVGRPADPSNEFDPLGLTVSTKPGSAINLWTPAQNKRPRRFEASHAGIRSLAFSPDARIIVTANADESLSVWEVLTGRECLRIKPSVVEKAVKKPAKVQDVLGIGPLPAITSIAISPDGRTLAATSPDRSVRLWELKSGQELGSFKGHQAPVLAVAFAPDSRTLISGAADTTALAWDAGGLLVANRPEQLELSSRQVDELWRDLAREPAKAYRAIHILSAAPKQALHLLRERVQPAKGIAPEQIKRLVADLDSARFGLRQKAMKELESLDELAEPALKEALANRPSLELRRRAEQMLERIVSGQTPDAGVQRAVRAVQVLEQIRTSEARQVLEGLARGTPASKLTRHAQAALKRMGK
jgi:WD40 repeat protein